jgi:hypothetical protein
MHRPGKLELAKNPAVITRANLAPADPVPRIEPQKENTIYVEFNYPKRRAVAERLLLGAADGSIVLNFHAPRSGEEKEASART